MDLRVTELHCIMPMANIGSVMTHDSKRQHLADAKRAAPPTPWVHAVDVVAALMINSVRRLSVQFHTGAVFRDTLLPKLNSYEPWVEHAEDLIEESP